MFQPKVGFWCNWQVYSHHGRSSLGYSHGAPLWDHDWWWDEENGHRESSGIPEWAAGVSFAKLFNWPLIQYYWYFICQILPHFPQDDGFIFLWVTGRAVELGRELLRIWGYERVDDIIWVKTNQLQRLIRTGRTGNYSFININISASFLFECMPLILLACYNWLTQYLPPSTYFFSLKVITWEFYEEGEDDEKHAVN